MSIWNILNGIGRRSPRSRPAARGRQADSPRVEQLEDRCLLSTVPVLAGTTGVTVMSYNIYQGSELDAIVAAPTVQAIPAAVSRVWAGVQATNFPQRALALSKEIAAAAPDLIGLQEAALWRIQTPGTAFSAHPTPATKVVYDFIDILVKDLAARGLHYAPVAVSPSFDGQLPDAAGDDIRLTDRVAILARTDKAAGPLQISNVQTHKFTINATIPLGGANGPKFTIYNSWASVDVTRNGDTFRFVTTHLDSNVPAINDAEARELLAGPAKTNLPVILSGDFNSPANGSGPKGYADALQAGFKDAWLQTNPHSPGFTWGQAQNLLNPKSQLSERIDYVLTHGGVQAVSMKVGGASPSDRTASGLWPSDHAGIVATLQIPHHVKKEDRGVRAEPGDSATRKGKAVGLARDIVVGLLTNPAKDAPSPTAIVCAGQNG
jgi:endonuclease/exonuclease/phosphatase family metal-dependent hydrolase